MIHAKIREGKLLQLGKLRMAPSGMMGKAVPGEGFKEEKPQK